MLAVNTIHVFNIPPSIDDFGQKCFEKTWPVDVDIRDGKVGKVSHLGIEGKWGNGIEGFGCMRLLIFGDARDVRWSAKVLRSK